MRTAALACALLLLGGAAQASSQRYCDRPAELDITQKDRLFRWGGLVKQLLERSGSSAALVSRSGLDLGRFGIRYSHAAVSLKDHPEGPWWVRQLYFACDEGRPRLYDQGLSGFLLGIDQPDTGYLSIVLLPAAAAEPLARAALDNPTALALLQPTYSANAYAWGLDYQNCNQWLVELLATAWQPGDASRAQAQQWLKTVHYTPTTVQVDSPWVRWFSRFVPYLHRDDHPPEHLRQHRFEITMPASIEAFVQQQWPEATRIEICHNTDQVVIHQGWDPVAEGCLPAPGDQLISLH